MDFDKYYKQDFDGAYNLHFLNKDKLSVLEIKKIFSVYGNVLSVNVTKDETGFRFVKYKTLEETISCIKGLQDGTKIQLLLEKSKIKDRKIKRDLNHDENLSNIGENYTHKTFNENNRLNDFLHSFQNSLYCNIPTPNITKNNASQLNEKSSRQTSMENNSLDILNYEKYYRTSKDGTYSVHFVNKKGLTTETIKDLFSSYGNVLSIYGEGQTGLKFVTYGKLEEVIKCLKGFQNNSQISLLPQKKMIGEANSDQNGSNQRQATRIENTSQKQFNANYTHNDGQKRISEYKEKPIYNKQTSDWNKVEGVFNFSDTPCNSRYDYKSNTNEIKCRNTGPQMFNEKYSSFKQQNSFNNENQVMKKQEETKLYSVMKTETDNKIIKNMQFSMYEHKIPSLISDTEMKESDAMSDSSLLNETKNLSKVVYIPMHEIIVANIPIKYGIHYILHLFDKYSPISATLVKTTSETNIPYCQVYFKTVQDAEAVEEEFDNFDLFGKNLIVLRKSRLIAESNCK